MTKYTIDVYWTGVIGYDEENGDKIPERNLKTTNFSNSQALPEAHLVEWIGY